VIVNKYRFHEKIDKRTSELDGRQQKIALDEKSKALKISA